MSLRTRFATHSSFNCEDRKHLTEHYGLKFEAFHCFLEEVLVIAFPTESKLSSVSRKLRFPNSAGILRLKNGCLVIYIGKDSTKWLIH